MPRGGQNKKPTVIKMLEGNPGKRPLPPNEPKPAPIAPKCPTWLGTLAKKEWKRITPQLERLGLLTEIDMANLAGYCHSYEELIIAQSYLSKYGLSYKIPKKDENGVIVGMTSLSWPEVKIVKECKAEIIKYSALFGMSPQDRSRMVVPGAADSSGRGFESLLSGVGISARSGKSG